MKLITWILTKIESLIIQREQNAIELAIRSAVARGEVVTQADIERIEHQIRAGYHHIPFM